MTAEELRRKFNDEFAFGDWPDHYEVDAETYANVCQEIFDRYGESVDDGIIRTVGTIKRMTISVGYNNGIFFKNVELILKQPEPTPAEVASVNGCLTIGETKVLYKLLLNQYISYENSEAIRIMKKLSSIFEGV